MKGAEMNSTLSSGWNEEMWSEFLNVLCATGVSVLEKGKNNLYLKYLKDGKKTFLVPLRELGLLSQIRREEDDYETPVVFLVLGRGENPTLKQPLGAGGELWKAIHMDPPFKDVCRSIYRGEYLTVKLPDSKIANNVLDVSRDNVLAVLDGLVAFLNGCPEFRLAGCMRKEFYKTFIDCYEGVTPEGEHILAEAESIYHAISGQNTKTLNRKHLGPKHQFRSPLAFCLVEFAVMVGELGALKERPFKVLLLDNRGELKEGEDSRNKFVRGSRTAPQEGPLVSRLFDLAAYVEFYSCLRGSKSRFEIECRMLGEASWNSNTGFTGIESWDEDQEPFHKKSYEDTKSVYRKKVHESIEKSDLVFIDFFLDEYNDYMAFDFVKSYSEEEAKSSSRITWFSIASGVHSAVGEYMSSGILSQFHTTALVDSGDDPEDERRKLIFLYKLVTFLDARMKGQKSALETICERLMSQSGTCPHFGDKECGQECYDVIMQAVARLDADKRVHKLLAIDKKVYQALLSADLVRQFAGIHEADWRRFEVERHHLMSLGNFTFTCTDIESKIGYRKEKYA